MDGCPLLTHFTQTLLIVIRCYGITDYFYSTAQLVLVLVCCYLGLRFLNLCWSGQNHVALEQATPNSDDTNFRVKTREMIRDGKIGLITFNDYIHCGGNSNVDI